MNVGLAILIVILVIIGIAVIIAFFFLGSTTTTGFPSGDSCTQNNQCASGRCLSTSSLLQWADGSNAWTIAAPLPTSITFTRITSTNNNTFMAIAPDDGVYLYSQGLWNKIYNGMFTRHITRNNAAVSQEFRLMDGVTSNTGMFLLFGVSETVVPPTGLPSTNYFTPVYTLFKVSNGYDIVPFYSATGVLTDTNGNPLIVNTIDVRSGTIVAGTAEAIYRKKSTDSAFVQLQTGVLLPRLMDADRVAYLTQTGSVVASGFTYPINLSNGVIINYAIEGDLILFLFATNNLVKVYSGRGGSNALREGDFSNQSIPLVSLGVLYIVATGTCL